MGGRPCDVCRVGERPGDPLLTCLGPPNVSGPVECAIVHEGCLAAGDRPSAGGWRCQPCSLGHDPSTLKKCKYCPMPATNPAYWIAHGTNARSFVHAICAKIGAASAEYSERYPCMVCKSTNQGTYKCGAHGCRRYMHPMCGWRKDLTPEFSCADDYQQLQHVYCPDHRDACNYTREACNTKRAARRGIVPAISSPTSANSAPAVVKDGSVAYAKRTAPPPAPTPKRPSSVLDAAAAASLPRRSSPDTPHEVIDLPDSAPTSPLPSSSPTRSSAPPGSRLARRSSPHRGRSDEERPLSSSSSAEEGDHSHKRRRLEELPTWTEPTSQPLVPTVAVDHALNRSDDATIIALRAANTSLQKSLLEAQQTAAALQRHLHQAYDSSESFQQRLQDVTRTSAHLRAENERLRKELQTAHQSAADVINQRASLEGQIRNIRANINTLFSLAEMPPAPLEDAEVTLDRYVGTVRRILPAEYRAEQDAIRQAILNGRR